MIVSCARLAGDYVVSQCGEEVGRIESIMIDVASGRVAHALVACGGVFGIGGRQYAIPWSAFTVDIDRRRLILTVELEDLHHGLTSFANSDTV